MRDDTFHVPFERHYNKANNIISSYLTFVDHHADEHHHSNEFLELMNRTWSFLRNDVVHGDKYRAALPEFDLPLLRNANRVGSAETSLTHFRRSPSWLQQNGQCVDTIKPGRSTLPNAGRGGFATRRIPAHAVILPVPLIHMHTSLLEIHNSIQYDYEHERYYYLPDHTTAQQQLLNYCFGHANSSVALFPYSPGMHYVNHHANPNAYLRWMTPSSPLSQFHHDDWLNQNATWVLEHTKPGLQMELVALRDVNPRDEIFIDYGRDWDEAYQRHVRSWDAGIADKTRGDATKPHTRLNNTSRYIPAHTFQNDSFVRTAMEQRENPYPPNVQTYCFYFYADPDSSMRDMDLLSAVEGVPDPLSMAFQWQNDDELFESNNFDRFHPCKILSRNVVHEPDTSNDSTEASNVFYTALLLEHSYSDETLEIPSLSTSTVRLVVDIPRSAIKFVNREYTSDTHLPKAFRRAISLPDDVFPASWIHL